MLDSDVAMLYKYKTRIINQTVKRNIKRFSKDVCFQLTEKESETLRCQFVTSKMENDNEKRHGGRRNPPYVFTELRIKQ